MGAAAERLLKESKPIQKAANGVNQHSSLLEANPALGINRAAQLKGLARRVSDHVYVVLGQREAATIDATYSGVEDCATAINGILLFLGQQKPPIRGERAQAIANKSYGVVKAMSRDPALGTTTAGQKELNFNSSVSPNDLELVEGDPETGSEPFVRVKNDATMAGAEVLCPAFIGKTGGHPRMPRHLWTGVMNVYVHCGLFDAPQNLEAVLAATVPPPQQQDQH